MDPLVEKEQVKLPQEISLISLIQSRYSEIKQIINEFKTSSPKLASQKLPIHMRRRAASHNVNRLPSKTRCIIGKKPRRKDQVSEYKERKRLQQKKHRNKNKVELSHAIRESKPGRSLLHIWFVKRFKMITMFNQLVPYNNTTKNQRKLLRMSKIGCTHFYLPQFKSIIIRIQNIEQISLKLSKVTRTDLNSFFDAHGGDSLTATWVQFFKGHEIIGPGYMILDAKNHSLIIWSHTLTHSQILHLLIEFHGSGGKVIDGGKIYQLFSLIGSEGLNHLKKTLGDCGSILPDDFQDGAIFSIKNFLSESSIESKQSKAMQISEDQDVNNFSLVHMSRTNNRDLILLSVPYSKAKDFWYKLVRNRTHLVGGLRDIKILASEMKCLHYPSTGYPDLPEDLNSHHKTWTQIMASNANSTEFKLIRDSMILSKLKYPHFNICILDNLLQSHPELAYSLVYVELVCINRGLPEEGDIICLPLESDVKKFIGRRKIDLKIEETGYGPVESEKTLKDKLVQQSSRKVIGLVEFGHFSLDLGTGKGFGAIAFTSLPELLKLNNDKLIALIRASRSNTFRFVEITIDHFKSF